MCIVKRAEVVLQCPQIVEQRLAVVGVLCRGLDDIPQSLGRDSRRVGAGGIVGRLDVVYGFRQGCRLPQDAFAESSTEGAGVLRPASLMSCQRCTNPSGELPKAFWRPATSSRSARSFALELRRQ